MLMTDEELSDLRNHISLARSKAVNFGLCLGRSSAKNLIMNVDRQKSPMLLERYAKLDGESPRSLRGTFRISGNRFVMDVQRKVPQGGAWQIHQFFRMLGYPYKVELIEPAAKGPKPKPEKEPRRPRPTDAAPMPAPPDKGIAPDDTPPAADDTPDPLQQRWAQLAPRMERALADFAASGAPKADAAKAAWQGTRDAAARGDIKSALRAAARIKAVIFEDPEADPAPDPGTDTWTKIAPSLGAQIDRHPRTSDKGARLHQAWDEAQARAAQGDVKTALMIAQKLVQALKRDPD